MSCVRRTSSCGSERRSSSLKKPPRERPMTIWVTFSNLAKRSSSAGRSLPVSVCVSAPRLSRELHRLVEPLARGLVEVGARPLDRDRNPRRIHQIGEALGGAHDGRRDRIGPDAGEDALARRPRPFDRLRLHALDQVGVDPLGGAAQRELAQRGQVLRLEEILDRARRGVLHVDLALGEALEQFVGRKIDQHDLVGLVEHRVGHGLAHPHLGDLLDDVVEAFEMLDVERGPDIDAGGQQFVDVLPALGMAAARHVGVGVFVDQQQARPARQRRVEVELLHHLVAVDDRLARQDLEAVDQLLGLAPAVRLDQAGDDVAAARLSRCARR